MFLCYITFLKIIIIISSKNHTTILNFELLSHLMNIHICQDLDPITSSIEYHCTTAGMFIQFLLPACPIFCSFCFVTLQVNPYPCVHVLPKMLLWEGLQIQLKMTILIIFYTYEILGLVEPHNYLISLFQLLYLSNRSVYLQKVL